MALDLVLNPPYKFLLGYGVTMTHWASLGHKELIGEQSVSEWKYRLRTVELP